MIALNAFYQSQVDCEISPVAFFFLPNAESSIQLYGAQHSTGSVPKPAVPPRVARIIRRGSIVKYGAFIIRLIKKKKIGVEINAVITQTNLCAERVEYNYFKSTSFHWLFQQLMIQIATSLVSIGMNAILLHCHTV